VSVRVEVHTGLPPDWPADGRSLLATPGWLRAMAGRLGAGAVTIAAREPGGAALAFAYGCVQTEARPGEFFDLHHVLVSAAPALPLTDAARAARTRLAAEAPPPPRWVPNLTVMLPGYECHVLGPGRRDPATLRALVAGAVEFAAGEGIGNVAFLYTTPDAPELAAVLTGLRFTAVPLSRTWDLRLPGSGVDDYFAALPRKRSAEARRELRLLREAGVTVAPSQVDGVFDRLVELRCRLVEKYRGRADRAVEAARLRVLVDEVAGGAPQTLVAAAGGDVVGFALFAEHNATWHALAAGYDYADPRSRLAYFGTAFYGAAERAYAAGVSRLGYGQGAWQAKRARGCRGTPLTGWFRSSDPDLAAAARASARVTRLVPG
jgi:hypothetical protein